MQHRAAIVDERQFEDLMRSIDKYDRPKVFVPWLALLGGGTKTNKDLKDKLVRCAGQQMEFVATVSPRDSARKRCAISQRKRCVILAT
jgi:hypothetical protein